MSHRFISPQDRPWDVILSLVYAQCLQDVSDWMIASKDIQVGTKSQREQIKKDLPTKLLDQDVTPTDSTRNLGVEFHKDFNLKKHRLYQMSVDHATIIYAIYVAYADI